MLNRTRIQYLQYGEKFQLAIKLSAKKNTELELKMVISDSAYHILAGFGTNEKEISQLVNYHKIKKIKSRLILLAKRIS